MPHDCPVSQSNSPQSATSQAQTRSFPPPAKMHLRHLLQLLLGAAHACAHALPGGYALPHSLHRRSPPPKLPLPKSPGPAGPGAGQTANHAFDPATGTPTEIVDPFTGRPIGGAEPGAGEGFSPITGQPYDVSFSPPQAQQMQSGLTLPNSNKRRKFGAPSAIPPPGRRQGSSRRTTGPFAPPTLQREVRFGYPGSRTRPLRPPTPPLNIPPPGPPRSGNQGLGPGRPGTPPRNPPSPHPHTPGGAPGVP